VKIIATNNGDIGGIWSSSSFLQKTNDAGAFFQTAIIGVMSVMAVTAIISMLIRKA
jgi:hypothetical protein